MKVITVPTPSLRERSVAVDLATLPERQQFIDKLIQTMYEDDGIGIASPQVGENIRLVIIGKEAIKHTRNKKQFMPQDLVLVNPVFTPTGSEKNWEQEGCLSVPGIYGDVERYLEGSVSAYDRHGNAIEFEATDFFARVIQHEIDHIDGILFIDKAKNIVTASEQHKSPAI